MELVSQREEVEKQSLGIGGEVWRLRRRVLTPRVLTSLRDDAGFHGVAFGSSIYGIITLKGIYQKFYCLVDVERDSCSTEYLISSPLDTTTC